MNDIQKSLIKIASQNPNIRKGLLKVLEQASNKEEAIKGIIKLAYVNPEIREYALPLIKEAARGSGEAQRSSQARKEQQKAKSIAKGKEYRQQKSKKDPVPENVYNAAKSESYSNITLKEYMKTQLGNQKLKNPALKNNPNAKKEVEVSTIFNHAAEPDDEYHEDSKKILEPYLKAIVQTYEKEKGEGKKETTKEQEQGEATPTEQKPAENSPQAAAEEAVKNNEAVIETKAEEISNLPEDQQDQKINEAGKDAFNDTVKAVLGPLNVSTEQIKVTVDNTFDNRLKNEETEQDLNNYYDDYYEEWMRNAAVERNNIRDDIKEKIKNFKFPNNQTQAQFIENNEFGVEDTSFEHIHPDEIRGSYHNFLNAPSDKTFTAMMNTLPKSVVSEIKEHLKGGGQEDIVPDIAQTTQEIADLQEMAQTKNEGKKGWFASLKDTFVKQFREIRDSSRLGESTEDRRKFLESKGLKEEDLYGDKREETYKAIEKFNKLNKMKEELGDDFKDMSMDDLEILSNVKDKVFKDNFQFSNDGGFDETLKKVLKGKSIRDFTDQKELVKNLKEEHSLRNEANKQGFNYKDMTEEELDKFRKNKYKLRDISEENRKKFMKGDISVEDLKNHSKGKEYGVDYFKLNDKQKENFKNIDSFLKDEDGKDKYDLKEGLFGGGEKKKIVDKIISGEYSQKDVENYMKSRDLGLDYSLIKDKEEEEKKLNETNEILGNLKGLTKKEKQRVIQEKMMGTFSKDHVETFNKIKDNTLSDEEREVIKDTRDPIEQAKKLKQHNDHKEMISEYAKDKKYKDETSFENATISYSEIQDLAKNGDDEDKKWAKKKLKDIEKDYEKHLQEGLIQKQKEKKGIEDLFKPKTEGGPEKRLTGPDGKKYTISQVYSMADNPKDPKSRDWAANQLKNLKEKVDVRNKIKDIFKPSTPGEAPQKVKKLLADGKPSGKEYTIDEMIEISENPDHEDNEWASKQVKDLEESVTGKLEADEKEIQEEDRVKKEEKVKELTSKKEDLQKNFSDNKQKIEDTHKSKIDSIDQEHEQKKKKIEDGVNDNIAKKTKETEDRIKARKDEDDKKIETIVNDKLKDKKDEIDKHNADLESAKALGADATTIKELEEKKAKAEEIHEKEKQTLMSKDPDIKDIIDKQKKFNQGQNSSLGTYKSKKEKEKNKSLKDLEDETSLSKSESERKMKEEVSKIEGEHKKQVKDIDKELTGEESKEETPEIKTEDIQKALPDTPPETVKKIETGISDMFEELEPEATEEQIEKQTKKVLKQNGVAKDEMDEILFAINLRRRLQQQDGEQEVEQGKTTKKKTKSQSDDEDSEETKEKKEKAPSMEKFFEGKTFTYKHIRSDGSELNPSYDFKGLLNVYKKSQSSGSGYSDENKKSIAEAYEAAKKEYEAKYGKDGKGSKKASDKKEDDRKAEIISKIKQLSKFDESDFDELKHYFDDDLKFDKERYNADQEKKRAERLKPIKDLKTKFELNKTKRELEDLKKKMESMTESKKASIRKQLVKIALSSKKEIKDLILPMI
jgi:hypothetical protein